MAWPPGRHGHGCKSSPPGYATYARPGFGTVETWKCWIAAG
jgi:hypothetical protein